MSDVVRLKITLVDTEPAIWRRVEVPSAITLKDLHAVIQAAMGWENSHLYQFHVGRQTINGPGFVDVGFSGQHNITAARVGLNELVESKVKRFDYLYDMGDSWEHELRVEKVLPAEPATRYPRFIGGAGACPPEDVGGLPGFYNLLEALEDPKHPNHEDMLDWCGGRFDPNALDEASIRKRLSRLGPRKKRKPA
ncbi:MAG TPA: plasmid pRiA4b ORF-3 family protein [Rhizomicrobium sp.]